MNVFCDSFLQLYLPEMEEDLLVMIGILYKTIVIFESCDKALWLPCDISQHYSNIDGHSRRSSHPPHFTNVEVYFITMST